MRRMAPVLVPLLIGASRPAADLVRRVERLRRRGRRRELAGMAPAGAALHPVERWPARKAAPPPMHRMAPVLVPLLIGASRPAADLVRRVERLRRRGRRRELAGMAPAGAALHPVERWPARKAAPPPMHRMAPVLVPLLIGASRARF